MEHLCELPANLARTEVVVRPCVALLHGYDPRSGLSADPEVSLIPILDAREVEAVFTAPLEGFLKSDMNGFDGYEDGHEWYRGAWGVWHDSNWRSKFDSFSFDCSWSSFRLLDGVHSPHGVVAPTTPRMDCDTTSLFAIIIIFPFSLFLLFFSFLFPSSLSNLPFQFRQS